MAKSLGEKGRAPGYRVSTICEVLFCKEDERGTNTAKGPQSPALGAGNMVSVTHTKQVRRAMRDPGISRQRGPAVTGLGAGGGGARRGTRAVRCGRERWWRRPAGRLANGPGGKGRRRGGAPAALWPGSPGRGLRAQPGRRGPAPRALFGARTRLKGIPGHGAPPLGDAWLLDPPRRADGQPGFPRSARGNQAWRAGAGARAPGTAPGGGCVQMGRGPRAPADGCEAGLGPGDKGSGQMFGSRCSREGGAWENPACSPAAFPLRRPRACREQGAAAVSTARGDREGGRRGAV